MELEFSELPGIFSEGFKRGFSESVLEEMFDEYRSQYDQNPETLDQLIMGAVFGLFLAEGSDPALMQSNNRRLSFVALGGLFVNTGALMGLTLDGWPYLLANIVGIILGFAVNYIGSEKIVWRKESAETSTN